MTTKTQPWRLQDSDGRSLANVHFEVGAPPRPDDVFPIWNEAADAETDWRVTETDERTRVAVVEPADG